MPNDANNKEYHTDFLIQIDITTTVLTPNRRLSAVLKQCYHEHQISLKNKAWRSPDILPINTWLRRLWEDYTSKEFTASSLLLNTVQEEYLWEGLLQADANTTPLLQISDTAQLVKSAYYLLKQWRVDVSHPLFQSSPDYDALHHWVHQYEAQCRKNNWIDRAELPRQLGEKIEKNKILLPKKIILFGFNEQSPQLQYLLNQCKQQNVEVVVKRWQTQPGQSSLLKFPQEEEELLTMARYAKWQLAQNKTTRIACIIPSLEKIRDRVERIFTEVFQPTENNVAMPYNISAGKNLLQYPVIRAAMQLLNLHHAQVSNENLSAILASPFVGDAEQEQIKRARFSGLIRKQNINTIDLIQHLNSGQQTTSLASACPKLAKRLSAFYEKITPYQAINPHYEWAKIFTELLTILGWPGERSLNSHEYQVIGSWQQALQKLTTLDHVATPVTLSTALKALQKILLNSMFQPQSPDAPIQILGILEAASLPFEHIWLTGMDDLTWPPRPKPNPFIPKSLQRELAMPHATSEREYFYCQQLTHEFQANATEMIFSYSEIKDDVELQASPLLRDIKRINIDQLKLSDHLPLNLKIFATKTIEILFDKEAPNCLNDKQRQGGTRIIQQQALCPFKAFAECRLFALDFDLPTPGLRAKDRGSLTHKAMELCWQEIKNYHQLICLTNDELTQIITKNIDLAFQEQSLHLVQRKHYLTLEKKRLHQLIIQWLDIEKQRPPFKVLMSEANIQIQLNELVLSLRVDRIDELTNGKKLIIDYKTGKYNDINHWFNTRPEEPQLPLYSLIDPDHTVGIAFAQLMPGEQTYKGISQESLGINGIRTMAEVTKAANTWEEQIQIWRTIFTTLSDDFYTGKASVDPKNASVCTYCTLKPLCRIHEEQ